MKKIFWTKWKIAPTIWPYPSGWGIYKRNILTNDKIILDTGLSKEQAKMEADILNKQMGKLPIKNKP